MLPAWTALVVVAAVVLVLVWLLWPQPKPRDYASIIKELEPSFQMMRRDIPSHSHHYNNSYGAWQIHREAYAHAHAHLYPRRSHAERVAFNVPSGKSVMHLFMYVPSAFAGRGFWRELQPIAVRPGAFVFDFVEPWVTEDYLVVSYA